VPKQRNAAADIVWQSIAGSFFVDRTIRFGKEGSAIELLPLAEKSVKRSLKMESARSVVLCTTYRDIIKLEEMTEVFEFFALIVTPRSIRG
jgi:hypothetical protein